MIITKSHSAKSTGNFHLLSPTSILDQCITMYPNVSRWPKFIWKNVIHWQLIYASILILHVIRALARLHVTSWETNLERDMRPFSLCLPRPRGLGKNKTLPKAQRTRGLTSTFQSNLLGHITSSNTNLDQTSSVKFTKQDGVRELVSQWVTSITKQELVSELVS